MLKAYLKNVVTPITNISERISGSLQCHHSKTDSVVFAYTSVRQFGQHRVWVNQLSMHLLWNMCPHASFRVVQPFTAFRQIVQEISFQSSYPFHDFDDSLLPDDDGRLGPCSSCKYRLLMQLKVQQTVAMAAAAITKVDANPINPGSTIMN